MNEFSPSLILSGRMTITDVKDMVEWSMQNDSNKSQLWNCAQSDDLRVSSNALWVISHFNDLERLWINSHRAELIDMLLVERNVTKKRIILQILREQEYSADDVRSDLLDFCFSKINSECEPYAVRCFSLYLAFKMCKHYPELLRELELHLELLELQSLSPGLKSALRQTNEKIRRLKKTNKN